MSEMTKSFVDVFVFFAIFHTLFFSLRPLLIFWSLSDPRVSGRAGGVTAPISATVDGKCSLLSFFSDIPLIYQGSVANGLQVSGAAAVGY